MRRVLTTLLFLSFLSFSFSQDWSSQLTELDQYVDKARKQWNVPGLSIAVVKDGDLLFAKGYGVRDIYTKEEVDIETLFAICSTTKAITAAALAMCVDEGKLKWDDRVIDHLPDFQLYDPYVTRELRVKDLLTHNAGLGNADFLWVYGYDSNEILKRMRWAEPSYSFRGGYTYQNIMYLAAGKVLEKVSGISWGNFLRQRIFEPLGMNNTFPYQSAAKKQENVSTPHDYIDGKISPIVDTNADEIGPAGSVWSSVEDMSKWVRFMLDDAKINGERLISEKNYKELLTPQIVIPYENFYPSKKLTKPHWTTYALGWFQHDYKGRFVSFHTGSLAGTVAILGMIPDEKLGVYVFGNLDHAEVRHALMYKVFDLFGENDPQRDWSSEMLELYKPGPAMGNEEYTARKEVLEPPLPLSDYTGEYQDVYWGKVKITQSGESQLSIEMGPTATLLAYPWDYNTFKAEWKAAPWRGTYWIYFDVDRHGKVNSMRIGNAVRRKKIE